MKRKKIVEKRKHQRIRQSTNKKMHQLLWLMANGFIVQQRKPSKLISLKESSLQPVIRKSYKRFPFDNLEKSLLSLIKAVTKDISRIQYDCEAYEHDLGVAKARKATTDACSRPLAWHLPDARNN